MAETIGITLALEKAGLPVKIHNAEELRTRLVAKLLNICFCS